MTDLIPDLIEALSRGGPALMLIAAVSVVTLALILSKLWQMLRLGAWRRASVEQAVTLWTAGDRDAARAALSGLRNMRASVARAAMATTTRLTATQAREETTRIARAELAQARQGLRALELIATIAPLLGLLGTVLGMIEAFQALQESGARADPAALAGGIWEALLTTAAGMAVAIPAGVALAGFDGLAERVQMDMEDAATRIFLTGEDNV